jgi:hypothetical protein
MHEWPDSLKNKEQSQGCEQVAKIQGHRNSFPVSACRGSDLSGI